MNKLERGNHSKINLDKVNKAVKLITVPILTTALSISFFTGCSKDKVDSNELDDIKETEQSIEDNKYLITSHNLEEEVTIPDNYQYRVREVANLDIDSPVKVKDLLKIKELSIITDSDLDLSWLNYCHNLEKVTFFVYDNGESLKALQCFDNLKHFDINFVNLGNAENFDIESLKFINNSKSIVDMDISFTYGFRQTEILDFIKDKNKITALTICAEDPSSYTLNLAEYPNLKKINFGDAGAYDLAIFLTNHKIQELYSRDIEIVCEEGVLDETIELNKELDNIIKKIDIKASDSDQEKINKILFYVLDNLEYDENIAYYNSNNIEHSDESAKFYQDGNLYGVFEMNGKAICGNYTALFQALSNRAGIESYYLLSHNHAWNLVNVDGEYYYMDTTWIDDEDTIVITMGQNGESTTTVKTAKEKILNGEEDDVKWYMMHPDVAKEYDQMNSHEVINMPNNIIIQPYEKNDENIAQSKFKISINNKVWIVSGAVVVGILAGLGIAVKKKKDKRKKRMEQYNNNYTFL